VFAFAGRKDGNVEEEEDQRVIWEIGANSVVFVRLGQSRLM